MTDGEANYIIHPPDFRKAIASEVDFYLQMFTLTSEAEAALIKCIYRFLQHYDLIYLHNQIINIVKELVNNAVKANLKRLYFKTKKLNINTTADYRLGMQTFKSDTYESDTDGHYAKLKRANLVVRVIFKTEDNYLYISVVNNVPILDLELEKINSRIKKAYQYQDISEAFDDVLDDSEGAGLGLIMALMIFKNIGMPPESFRVYRKNGLTIAAIAIPQTMSRIKSRVRVSDEILKEIDAIPAFPENIMRIQQLCHNAEATIKEIANAIALDPGLTTSILKLANSAGYITLKKTETIEEAVKIIGVKGISNLLLATGVHKVMDSRYKRAESIWMDSYKRAAYAHRIAIQMSKIKAGDFLYLGALLADVGTIVLLSLKSSTMKRLQRIAGTMETLNTDLIEEITLGVSHAAIGAMIFKKWNFDEALIKMIEFHHRPHMAPRELKQLLFILYLADCMVEIDAKRFRYEYIDEEVLEFFNLTNPSSFMLLQTMLRESYASQAVNN